MTKIPFTADQVESINSYQRAGIFHPFTCGNDGETLEATPEGMRCPKCSYAQDWVHDFMANWTWRPPEDWPSAPPEEPEK
jgi:hypothetical protein